MRLWTRGRVPSCCCTRRENKHRERTEANGNTRAWRQETPKRMNKGVSRSRLYSFLDVLGAASRKTLGIAAQAPLATSEENQRRKETEENDSTRDRGAKKCPNKRISGCASHRFTFSLKAWPFPRERHWALPHGHIRTSASRNGNTPKHMCTNDSTMEHNIITHQ